MKPISTAPVLGNPAVWMPCNPSAKNMPPVRAGRLLRNQPGSIIVAAMTALVVALILVLGMIVAGTRTLAVGKRETQTASARQVAEAGIEYAYWQYAYNQASLPSTFSRSFGPGSFTATLANNSTSVTNTITLTSKGTVKSDSVTIARVIVKPKTVFDFAFSGNISLVTSAIKIVTGANSANGDIRSNGWIAMSAPGTKINGDAVAQQTTSNTPVTGKQISYAAPLAYPTINTTYYSSIANRSFASAQTWSGFTFLVPYEVVYVNGDVTINTGTITGTGTIVCTGKFHCNGDTTYATAADKIAFLSVSGMDSNNNASVVGFYYCHNSAGSAAYLPPVGQNFTVTNGSFANDTYTQATATANYTFTHDPAMNEQLGTNMHLPGY